MKVTWTFIALTFLIIFSICCGQSVEERDEFQSPSSIAFKVNNPIDSGEEGEDYVEIEMTKGTADSAILIYTPKDRPTVSVDMTTTDNIIFSTNIVFKAHQTEWFITASSLTASTQYGASNDLEVNEKYLNKTNADNLILNVMNEKRSSGEILSYAPNNLGDTHDLTVDSETVAVDHYVRVHTLQKDFEEKHSEYIIKYSTELNDDLTPSSNNTSTYGQFAVDQTRDLGYIIIASTDRGGLEQILSNGQFFKDSVFLSELSGDNLQLIRY